MLTAYLVATVVLGVFAMIGDCSEDRAIAAVVDALFAVAGLIVLGQHLAN